MNDVSVRQAVDVGRGAARTARAPSRTFHDWSARQFGGLIWTLVRTDFKARYHGTLSGFVWALLKPIAMFVVLMLVFSLLFASNPTYKLDLIVGLFLWDFFAEGTKVGLTSLHARSFLLSKARCPAWVLVATSISNALITLVVFCGVIVVFLFASGRAPSLQALGWFAFYCGALVAMVLGFALGTSALFLRYRDLNQVWEVIVQAGFFVAPIIYPVGIIPERYHFYLYLWPPTPVIEFARAVLVTGTVPTVTAHVYLAIDASICLLAGVALFAWLSPRAAEYV